VAEEDGGVHEHDLVRSQQLASPGVLIGTCRCH